MRAVPKSRYIVFFALGLVGCLIDLATKHYAFAKLGPPDHFNREISWVWVDVFGFQTSLNEGALFGLGQGGVPVFTALSFIALIALLVWLFVFGAAKEWLLTISLGCVTAGILGNLYDRLGLPGLDWPIAFGPHQVGDPVYAVRDWIVVMIGPWQWPNFNIADSLLVCGAILLAWQAFRSGNAAKQAPESACDS